MIYRSNLSAPDLSTHFKLLSPAKQICGHDAPSDPDFEPECTFWTHDEAAILYNIAKQVRGNWADIGSRYGWTSAHLMEAGCLVELCDPIYRYQVYQARMEVNLDSWFDSVNLIHWCDSENLPSFGLDGVVIDGNHDAPYPLRDAIVAHGATKDSAVILLHDFWGKPIRDAANWLIDQGYSCRVYWTPNGVAVLWRGMPDFAPPDHVRDPAIDWSGFEHIVRDDFDLGRCV